MNVTLPPPAARATLRDLEQVADKAELIGGRIVRLLPTGHRPNVIAGRLFRRLADYADATGRGVAYTDNMGFAVPPLPSGRESFSPDAAYYTGPLPANVMRYVQGPPDFAVEVRSEGDYGPAAEGEQAAKRADYFAAGTRLVWDVDPSAGIIRAYWATAPGQAVIFSSGHEADAEPILPGWRVSVDWLMA